MIKITSLKLSDLDKMYSEFIDNLKSYKDMSEFIDGINRFFSDWFYVSAEIVGEYEDIEEQVESGDDSNLKRGRYLRKLMNRYIILTEKIAIKILYKSRDLINQRIRNTTESKIQYPGSIFEWLSKFGYFDVKRSRMIKRVLSRYDYFNKKIHEKL